MKNDEKIHPVFSDCDVNIAITDPRKIAVITVPRENVAIIAPRDGPICQDANFSVATIGMQNTEIEAQRWHHAER